MAIPDDAAMLRTAIPWQLAARLDRVKRQHRVRLSTVVQAALQHGLDAVEAPMSKPQLYDLAAYQQRLDIDQDGL